MMDNSKWIKAYFLREYENEFNKLIHEAETEELLLKVRDYVERLCDTPIQEFIDYILFKSEVKMISAEDIYQYSRYEVAIFKTCGLLNECTKGLSYEELGIALQNDGVIRSKIANEKYGSNHFKLAECFGLAYRCEHKCFVSALGLTWSELGEDKRRVLVTRLILRSNLIQKIIKLGNESNGEVDLEAVLYDISEKTYLRRKPCIRRVIEELTKSVEHDFSDLADRIKY